MPSTVSWPEMGGTTAHPTGATLALGDPSVSLNAPQRNLSYHRQRGALILAPWAAVRLVLVPVAAACAAIEFGQDSGTRSAPLHHRGSTTLAFCLTVFVPESRAVPPFRSKREVHLEGTGGPVVWPWVVAVWPGGEPTGEVPKWLVEAERLSGQPLMSLGQILGQDLDLALH